jgi:hypothetical protein
MQQIQYDVRPGEFADAVKTTRSARAFFASVLGLALLYQIAVFALVDFGGVLDSDQPAAQGPAAGRAQDPQASGPGPGPEATHESAAAATPTPAPAPAVTPPTAKKTPPAAPSKPVVPGKAGAPGPATRSAAASPAAPSAAGAAFCFDSLGGLKR